MTPCGGCGDPLPSRAGRGTPCGLAAAALALLCLCAVEPALANKFETIGSGLSGSSSFKRSWLTRFLVISGSLSLFMGLLAMVFPHKNAAYLNYDNWKLSALVLFAVGGGFLLFATLI